MAKVKVSQGLLEGEVLDLVTGDGQYYSFKGIPYAAPPVGKLRFKAPQPPLPWTGVRKATTHGAISPQQDLFTQQTILGSEDCLFLNVYTKTIKPKKALPVMVFIHGGGYRAGSGNVDNYGPDFLVNHDVVLVTINYRLETFGFLCLDTEEVPGNAGLKDQSAAFRWVKDNIANFGGDSENITIFGESAGGASVAYHLLSPLSKGLFKRAISMSGVPTCDFSLSYKPRERAFALGKLLGFETEDPNELLEFLQSVPVEKLINTNPVILASEVITAENMLKLYHFTPVVEKIFGSGHFITESPIEIVKKGKVNEVDVFIGHTSAESLIAFGIFDSLISTTNKFAEAIVPRELLLQLKPDDIWKVAQKIRHQYFGDKKISKDNLKEFVEYASDATFNYDIYRFLSYYPKIGNSKVYVYKFSCVSERNLFGNEGKPYGVIGASHLDDCLYLFDPKARNLKLEKGTQQYNLIQLVNTVWTNFAKFGTPTPDASLGVTAPEYISSKRELVLNIGDQLTVEKHSTEIVNFWKAIYEEAGVLY